MASLYGRPPRPQKKVKAKSKLQFIRNERKQSMAISARRQLGIGYNEK